MNLKIIVIGVIVVYLLYTLFGKSSKTEQFTPTQNDTFLINKLIDFIKTKPTFINYLNFLNENNNKHHILIRKDIYKSLISNPFLKSKDIYNFLD